MIAARSLAPEAPPAPPAPADVWRRQDLRRVWSRTDTARWLNARSSGVLAYVRRFDPDGAPQHSKSMGRWLQAHAPTLFTRAHTRLTQPGFDAAAREQATVPRILA
jgi:hypothetical protein